MSRKQNTRRNRQTTTTEYEVTQSYTRRQSKRVERNTSKFGSPDSHNISSCVIVPKTDTQKDLIHALYNFDQVVVSGPAGTGKTWVTVSYAAQQYVLGKIDKIVITRPNVGVGKGLGFMPGDLQMKMSVWLAETISILVKHLGAGAYECGLKNGSIEIVAFEHIRGRSFSNAFVIVTEAQNLSVDEAKSLVTRIGEDSKLVVDGDTRQSDLGSGNGLSWILDKVQDNQILRSMTGVVEFTFDDCVRSKLCKEWIRTIWKD